MTISLYDNVTIIQVETNAKRKCRVKKHGIYQAKIRREWMGANGEMKIKGRKEKEKGE
jgi:hypothetical protein